MGKKKGRKRKRNSKGKFVRRVKETVGTESNGGQEYNDFIDMDWGMDWY